MDLTIKAQNMNNSCDLDNKNNTFHFIYIMCKRPAFSK